MFSLPCLWVDRHPACVAFRAVGYRIVAKQFKRNVKLWAPLIRLFIVRSASTAGATSDYHYPSFYDAHHSDSPSKLCHFVKLFLGSTCETLRHLPTHTHTHTHTRTPTHRKVRLARNSCEATLTGHRLQEHMRQAGVTVIVASIIASKTTSPSLNGTS